jgi:thymidylate kinase
LNAVYRAFDAAGIRWALLRGGHPADGDVDLHVSLDDMARAALVLEGFGFIEQRSTGYRPHRFFLRAGNDGWIKLDLVTELRFGPVAFLAPGLEGALSRRRKVGATFRLDPPDEFWALLLHGLLDKPAIDERRRNRLRSLAPHALASPAVANLFASRAEAEALVEAAMDDRWDRAGAWARTLAPSGTRARLVALRRAVARRIGWRLTPLHRRGVTVALLAPDGAGKTTTARLLARTFPIPVRTIYMGLYKNPRRRLPPGVGLAARVALQWSRYTRALYHRRRGRVVLFDRYIYDAEPAAASRARFRDRLRRSVLARSLPRPDLILVLDAPADELLRRKGEHDLARLERDRAHYRAVSERTSTSSLIDATRPPDVVVREVSALIWTALAARS